MANSINQINVSGTAYNINAYDSNSIGGINPPCPIFRLFTRINSKS